MPSAKFEEVYKKTREIKTGPSNDDLLNLYAYAKVAQGEDIEKAPKPGMMDFTVRLACISFPLLCSIRLRCPL
ncbi:hypothetical protein DPSP01_004725 [Paraphaeosphaeria sporulosa]